MKPIAACLPSAQGRKHRAYERLDSNYLKEPRSSNHRGYRCGLVYEQVGQRQDRKRFPQIGQSVDIGGRTLNISCSGEGSPTVILEGGYSWINVQPQIAKFTRVCWYDRAGFGWSDPGPHPRTSAAIASDLHEVLHAAAVPPPYVLVGASFGGFIVRVFAGKYPGEVAGMALVDASHEDQHEPTSMKSTAVA